MDHLINSVNVSPYPWHCHVTHDSKLWSIRDSIFSETTLWGYDMLRTISVVSCFGEKMCDPEREDATSVSSFDAKYNCKRFFLTWSKDYDSLQWLFNVIVGRSRFQIIMQLFIDIVSQWETTDSVPLVRSTCIHIRHTFHRSYCWVSMDTS